MKIHTYKHQVHTLDLSNPTAPTNYVAQTILQGSPVHWRDDVFGKLAHAILAYLNRTPTAEQLRMVIAYLQHHIHAPCWLEQSPYENAEEALGDQLRALRSASLAMVAIEDVDRFLLGCIQIGLDPL
jgi:hypothetical protein